MMWNYDDERWGRMHDSDGVGWVMVLLMLIVVIAVVVAVVALLRGTTTISPAARPAAPRAGAPDARTILQERFARGDIDEEDFRARMRALDETGT
jgi:putative membrane protein